MAGAVTAGVLVANHKLGLLTATLAMAMALTRLYVGVHWPLDVGAGLAVGALVAGLIVVALRPLLTRLVAALSQTPARALLTAGPAH